MKITIVNTNEDYGSAVEFTAATEELAASAMQEAVRACGIEFSTVVVTAEDYDIATA